jgi:hypothetical protein
MSDPPRRRRSPSSPPPRRPPSGGSSLLPTIALGIGVVVAGLGIGAFLSALQGKHASTSSTSTTTTRVAQMTPVPQVTREALATPVPHPTATPTAEPSPTPEPSATPAPSRTPAASATPRPSATPAPTPTARPSALASAAALPEPTEKPSPRPSAEPTERPTPRPTAAPTLKPVVTPHPATPAPRAIAVTAVGAAQNTVRRYLADLIAGNENGAYAELGKAPGDAGAQLSEEAFIDRSARITSIRTTGTDATGTTIGVDITSSRGTYYATYHVTNGPGGVIDQHDYIKV